MISRPPLDTLVAIAIEAGALIETLYRDGCAVSAKADRSPVTEADRAAEALILAGLRAVAPDLPIIAEEEAAAGRIPTIGRSFALVDPLDGTREFIDRTDEFTVNIAVIEDEIAVMGVIYAPILRMIWAGEANVGVWRSTVVDGATSMREAIAVRTPPPGGLTALASRSHRSSATDEWLTKHDIVELTSAGSSLKFCRIAEGAADVYPRFGRTMEWDTAAGQAIVEAAGGRVTTAAGDHLRYGKIERGFDNPHFIVWGDRSKV